MLAALTVLLLSANPYLAEGKRAYLRLQYARAQQELELAWRVPGSPPADRRAIGDLLARALAAQGKMVEAEAAYRTLLAEDARAPEPRDAAPKIRALFMSAKRRLYPPPSVALHAEDAPEGEVLVGIRDPWDLVHEVALEEGTPAVAGARRKLTREGDEARGPRAPGPGHRVVALDAAGKVLARLELAEPPPAEAPVLRPKAPVLAEERSIPLGSDLVRTVAPPPHRFRGAAWTAVAVGAVAVGVGAGFALSSASSSRGANAAADAVQSTRLYQQARTRALAANWLIGGGVALAAAGGLVLGLDP